MRVDLSDGEPVSYGSVFVPANSDQRPCTTQSTGGSTDVSTVGSFYTPSPTLPLAETTQPPQQPLGSHSHSRSHSHSHPHPHPDHIHSHSQAFSTAATALGGAALQTYPHPQIHSAASAQGMWPTPPDTSGDEFDNYSYQGSPMSSNCAIQTAPPCNPRSSVNSPRSWSSPDVQQLNFQPAIWKSPEEIPPYSLRINTPAQHESAFQHQLTAESTFNGAIYAGAHLGNADTIMQQDTPPMIPDVPETDSAFSPSVDSPQMKSERSDSFHFGSTSPPRMPVGALDGQDAPKRVEPYSRLIYKALLSRNPHKMSLQEIYDWFEENTDRAVGPGKGWQNSVRHNLSMNAAFVKADRRRGPGDPLPNTVGGKKNTEWVLENWAVVEGVQSTTRYRNKNGNNRRGGSSRQRAHGGNLSARASSGRKGGITASRTKAAATRKPFMRGREAQSPAAAYCLANNQRNPIQSALYDRRFGYQYPSGTAGEPVTPPDLNASNMLFSTPAHAAATLSPGHANQGYMHHGTLQQQHDQSQQHHGYSQQHHHQQQQLLQQQLPQQQQSQHHQQAGTIYTLDDISDVYQGPSAHLPGRPQGASTTIPAAYNAIFANADVMSDEKVPYLDWGNSGADGTYQS